MPRPGRKTGYFDREMAMLYEQRGNRWVSAGGLSDTAILGSIIKKYDPIVKAIHEARQGKNNTQKA